MNPRDNGGDDAAQAPDESIVPVDIAAPQLSDLTDAIMDVWAGLDESSMAMTRVHNLVESFEHHARPLPVELRDEIIALRASIDATKTRAFRVERRVALDGGDDPTSESGL